MSSKIDFVDMRFTGPNTATCRARRFAECDRCHAQIDAEPPFDGCDIGRAAIKAGWRWHENSRDDLCRSCLEARDA